MKRFLSLILCLAMVLTMLPPQVFATETEQTTTEQVETTAATTTPVETTAAAEETGYAVTWEYTPEHMTIEGAAAAVAGEAYTATLTEAACCDVLSFDVRINSVYIDEDKYTYVQSTGVLTIPAGIIDGDISISVLSRQKHTEATRTEEYAATCMEMARTDTVVYCTECGLELSRSTGYGDYAPHEAGTEAARVEPTCQASGGTGYYCKYGCGTVIIEEVLEQLSHTPGERELSGEWYIIHCAVCGSAYDTEYALTQQEAAEKMLALVNELRAENGLNPLVLTQEAIELATLRAVEIVTDYSHDSAGGYNDGYGENIIASDATLQEMFDRWCDSPGHLANMLTPEYEEFGFGFLPAENGQALYGVQLFNRHKDADRDHKCDRGCEGTLGAHEDTVGDGNHICDYCWSEEILTPCSGGTANCQYPAVCDECGGFYGETDRDVHESEAFTYTWTMPQHTAFHACCGVETVTEDHDYENGLCVCGKEEPAGYGYLENFYWELDPYGTMTILGSGAIEDGSAWAKYAAQVKVLEIDSRITSIGEDAFAGFADLSTLSFPGTASVAKNAFTGCAALKNITVTGTGAMEDYTETTCKNLPWFCTDEAGLTVTLAEGLTTVGAYAFCGAENVAAVVLPEGLETIGEKAFRGSGLVNISVPDTVTAIAADALSELKKCTVLELPDSVVSLGDGALRGSAFQAVKLPGNLTAIGSELLKDCENLNTVNIPEGVTVIGREAFRGCKALMGIRLPDGVTRIEDGAFRSCAMLYTVILPEKLTEIGAYAFAADTYLVTLTIKSTELTVGENAFSGCSTLARVYFSGTKEQWEALSIASGNGALTGAKVHFCTETGGPVQQLQILHRSGLQLPEGEALEGRNILVNMAQGSEIVLGYAVWPEDAVNQEVIWDNNNRTVVDAAVNAEGGYTLTGKQAGDVTVVVMNYGSGGNYTYVNTSARFQFRRMVMADSFRGYMTPNGAQQLEAYIEGDGDLDRGILWTMVEDQTGEAKLTSDGLLTVGENQGTVTVRAEAADGSGLSVTAMVTVINYAVVISGPTQVASGKSITLTAELVPPGLTNTKILWKLKNPGDSQFVTLNNGKITAKTVKEAQEVVVVAYPADGVAAQAEITVTVVPITASVAILQGEMSVTGQTIPVNLSTWKEALTFTAVTAPEDASKAVKWTTSDSKDTYAAYTAGDDGSYTLVPTGKTGTVTLTATAADGSGKKATVKVQFVKAATEIRILNAPEAPIRAGSKLTLTTSVATEAELTDRAVVWSLSEDSLPYASITDKGVLTTYAYPGQVTITVTAAVRSDPSICDQKTIVLKPGATAAVISCKGESLAKNEIVYAAVGEAVTLTGSTLPEEAIQSGIWKVSGKGAVLADNGDGTATVTMSAAGTATVTFTAADGSKKSLAVKIQAIQRGGDMTITAKGGATELRSGKTLQLTATIPGATLKKFNWTVDKPELATVSATGAVKALTIHENATVTVTATAIDGSGLTADYELLLRPAKDQTLHIRLNGEVITGATQYLHLNGAGQTLTTELYDSLTGQWTAVTANLTLSGKKLMLDGTTVKGLATGSGTVTAKYGKLSAKVTFKAVNPMESITLYEKNGTYHTVAGKSLTLKANLFGAGGLAPTEKKLKWTVDNPAAATVSASGVVKANKNLTRQTVITVTASATDGSGVSATREITLYPLPTAILISANGVVLNQCVREFKVGDTLTLDANILPGDALQDVTFSISGKLATLETAGDGIVTLKLNGEGTLTIKAATRDGSKRTVTVKIKIVK